MKLTHFIVAMGLFCALGAQAQVVGALGQDNGNFVSLSSGGSSVTNTGGVQTTFTAAGRASRPDSLPPPRRST